MKSITLLALAGAFLLSNRSMPLSTRPLHRLNSGPAPRLSSPARL